MTDLGRSLLVPLDQLVEWSAQNDEVVKAARKEFDRAAWHFHFLILSPTGKASEIRNIDFTVANPSMPCSAWRLRLREKKFSTNLKLQREHRVT